MGRGRSRRQKLTLIVFLAGDWNQGRSRGKHPKGDGFEPEWELQNRRAGEILRYDGIPIFDGPDDGDRRLYVVEPATWGCFVRAQVEGGYRPARRGRPHHGERARELLDANPNLFTG